MSEHDPFINIEVAYAGIDKQSIIRLCMPCGSSVQAAVDQSNILSQFPEIALLDKNIGIFGKACKLADTLKDGDRVEIYRPLKIDPKRKRELLANSRKR